MKNVNHKTKTNKYPMAAVLLLIAVFLVAITLTSGYFTAKDTEELPLVVDVEGLFGRLNSAQNPTGEWGTDNNPYLIYNTQHLQNLYVLQNSKDIKAINQNTVFQVSNPDASPCYVGGSSPEALFPIPSIGSEDFPFISTFRGVKATDSAQYVYFNGYVSDTSVLGNIEVTAHVGQIDIGLFGHVGKRDPNDTTGEGEDIQTTGYIGELLLSNIMVSTNAIGDIETKEQEHPYPDDFFSTDPDNKESNHIGILAGHAQYTLIEKISVHYANTVTGSGDTRKVSANINAFNIAQDDDAAKYTTAGGIIGFYKQIIVPDYSEYPINSDGISPSGSLSPGFGLGVLYSVDIWNYMQSFSETELGEQSYGLKTTFAVGEDEFYSPDSALDGLTKTFFRIGVFTLVHTREALNEDSIAKLWASDADEDPSKMWKISTSGTGTYALSDATVIDSNAKKYTVTQLTTNNLTSSGSSYYYPSTSAFPGIGSSSYNNSRYRYMIVVESGGIEYAVVKHGESISTQKIDTSNFIIPEDMLIYYTFRVATSINKYEGQTPDGRERFSYGASAQLRINGANSYTSYKAQYFLYGKTYPTDASYPAEEERPLRIFTPPSFVYSSATGTTQSATNEYSRLNISSSGSNTVFALRRYTSDTSGASYYIRFSQGNGYYGASSAGTSVIKIYVVNTESATSAVYSKDVYEPVGATATYDMSKHVLQYVGTYDSNTSSEKYKYNLVSLESLNLPDNLELPITQINSRLKMGDPSSFYYLGGTYYGILKDIPVKGQPDKVIYAPRGSVAVTVNNTGVSNDKSDITVIVATDPSQLVDQEITISRFNSTNANGVPRATGVNITGITQITTFVLPPVPGSPTSGTSRTTPISVRLPDTSIYRTAYPNMQTLLVAYTLTVDVSGSRNDPPTTYFLESSKGAANFVYFSVDKTATGLSNPTHKNEAYFSPLNGVDFVFDLTQGTDKKIATVSSDDYIKSLIMPFFGVTLPKNSEVLTVVNARDFSYRITRIYDENETKKHQMHIDIIVPEPPTLTAARRKELWELINFNFFDGTYFDTTNYMRVNSDYVVIYINGTAIAWEDFY